MIAADFDRAVDKIELALMSAQTYFERQSEANAALHGSGKVLYSPIVTTLEEAKAELKRIRDDHDS